MFGTLQPVPSLIGGFMNYTVANDNGETSSALGASGVLPTLLESFIPGYGMIRALGMELLGLDVSVFLPLIAMLLALHAGSVYIFGYFRDSLEQYCTCAVDMNEWDPQYEAIMRWLNEKHHFRRARYLRIAGRWWERITARPEQALAMWERFEVEQGQDSATSRTPIFNTDAKKPTGFEPDEGKYYFWYKGRPFCLNLYFKEMKHREVNFQKVRLSCYGFSTEPLKALIKEAMDLDIEEEHMTDFFRPYPQDSEWKRVNTRPSRPLDTVTLDTAQKTRIVQDLNDFVHPARKQWYASRGIPYRRGYLFSGPPGTGKTSLSLALAGVFNLSLYAVSIQDPTMSDTRLTELFDDLPNQCIVLLEDIDSAGVVQSREYNENSDDEASGDSNSETNDSPKVKHRSKRSKVTLAGLLNAIDGVASHEGHVLIMTTNHPEKLDGALKRPGRVDLHIEFTMATIFQAREIFLRLFTDEKPGSKQQQQSQPQAEKVDHQQAPTTAKQLPTQTEKHSTSLSRRPTTVEEACRERWQLSDHQFCPFMTFSELQSLADMFGSSLPDQTFSPAEIQGYLLLHKTDPRFAAQNASCWATATIKQKKPFELANQMKTEIPNTETAYINTPLSSQIQAQLQVRKPSHFYQRRKVQRHQTTLPDNGSLTPGPSDEDNDLTTSQGEDAESDIVIQP